MDLEGLRFRFRDDVGRNTFLVLDGKLQTLGARVERQNTFSNWNQVWTVDNASSYGFEHDQGFDYLALVRVGDRIMLQANLGYFRHIRTVETFDRFGFNWDQIGKSSGHQEGQEIYWQPVWNGDLPTRHGAVFLVDFDKLRHIVDFNTYRDVFGATGAVAMDAAPPRVGPDFYGLNRLIRSPGHNEIYLLDVGLTDKGLKRHIKDPNTMMYYGFDKGVVHEMSYEELVKIPDGYELLWPAKA